MVSVSQEVKQRYWKKKRESAPSIKCLCGCGEDLPAFDNYGRPAKYINGHNARKYSGDDATRWAVQKRWRTKNPDKVRDAKRAFYRKRKLIAMEMLGNKCGFCSVTYNGKNAPIFEFHHRNPHEKEKGVTRLLINRSWEITLKELKLCELVCANCHNQHHGGEW